MMTSENAVCCYVVSPKSNLYGTRKVFLCWHNDFFIFAKHKITPDFNRFRVFFLQPVLLGIPGIPADYVA